MLVKNYVLHRIELIHDEKTKDFIMTFIVCEYVYKTLHRSIYNIDKNNNLNIKFHDVEKTFLNIGYQDVETLKRIFGGRESNSYLQKRNKILHRISRKTIQDIHENIQQYIEDMKSFIDQISAIYDK
jgi:hypothetical protein